MENDYPLRSRGPLSRAACSSSGSLGPSTFPRPCPEPRSSLSIFECIISTHPPVLESLLLQLPTSSILDLYHTSKYLRSFLQGYPIAWNNLSFRSLSPGRLASRQTSPASDSSGDATTQHSKPFALDQLLVTIILPFGTRLKSLEVDHTAVSGDALTTCVLHGRRETIQHLSVRGCKQVSLKYNIVPFLSLFKLQRDASRTDIKPILALRSLYTFRCRHHRRRPYTPASLTRRDSDSAPTHDLIEICHKLGIWTDTAWCPTPGGRCLRRKDYSVGRGTPDARAEVWVVYDRLWRSGNRLGPSLDLDRDRKMSCRGQLWEDAESGYNGEALGCDPRPGQGEGKLLPTHLRQSYRKFVERVKCHDCGAPVDERCEHCSIRMHCTGCRKTLCENCAFSRPLPAAKGDDEAPDQKLWWAPNHIKNPNAMLQEVFPSTTPDNNGNIPNSTVTPAVKMQWCCLRPMCSNGGSISFVGPGMMGSVTNHLRTVPLPKGESYEDPEFKRLMLNRDVPPPKFSSSEEPDPGLQWLSYGPGSQDQNACPRNLCQECWNMPGWKASCQACHEPFCFAHDLRGLSLRVCGYKDLAAEKAYFEERSKFKDILETWATIATEKNMNRTELKEDFQNHLQSLNMTTESLHHLEQILPGLTWPIKAGSQLRKAVDDLVTLQRSENPSKKGETPPPPPEDDGPEPAETETLPGDAQAPKAAEAKSDWRGCGAFVCPKYRAVGDHRPKCPAAAHQCTLCDVHVCPECLAVTPPCDCSYCVDHYRCPNCFHMLADLCKKAEEDEAQLRKECEEELKRAIVAHKLRVYEEAIERAGEFMATVFGENERYGDVS